MKARETLRVRSFPIASSLFFTNASTSASSGEACPASAGVVPVVPRGTATLLLLMRAEGAREPCGGGGTFSCSCDFGSEGEMVVERVAWS